MIKPIAPRHFQLNCRGRVLSLAGPQVMGIINLDPQSFCTIGKYSSIDPILTQVEQFIAAGAAIVDIGGEATNPQVQEFATTEQQELDRVIPVIEQIHANFSLPISIDTSRPNVMRAAVAAGAGLINDVRALRLPEALATASALQVPVCLMHMAHLADDTEHSMQNENIVSVVIQFLHQRFEAALAAGILPENIIVDPGFGGGRFGKTTKQNLQLLKHLSLFQEFNRPILIGVSRKLFIGDILKQDASERLYGSIAAALLAALQGVSLLRVHDVKATVDGLRILQAIQQE